MLKSDLNMGGVMYARVMLGGAAQYMVRAKLAKLVSPAQFVINLVADVFCKMDRLVPPIHSAPFSALTR